MTSCSQPANEIQVRKCPSKLRLCRVVYKSSESQVKIMTREQRIKKEIQHLTRRIWGAMCLSVLVIVGWGALTRAIHLQGKEPQNANTAR